MATEIEPLELTFLALQETLNLLVKITKDVPICHFCQNADTPIGSGCRYFHISLDAVHKRFDYWQYRH